MRRGDFSGGAVGTELSPLPNTSLVFQSLPRASVSSHGPVLPENTRAQAHRGGPLAAILPGWAHTGAAPLLWPVGFTGVSAPPPLTLGPLLNLRSVCVECIKGSPDSIRR